MYYDYLVLKRIAGSLPQWISAQNAVASKGTIRNALIARLVYFHVTNAILFVFESRYRMREYVEKFI
jgi:hypothetical protein